MKVGTIEVDALPTQLFGAPAVLDEVDIVGVTADEKVLNLVLGLLEPKAKGPPVGVRRLKFRAVKIAFRGIDIPGFNADLVLAGDGTLKQGTLFDGRMNVSLVPKGRTVEAQFSATRWDPPIGPPIPFDELSATAVIEGRQARISKIEATWGRGTLKGSATVSWNQAFQLNGDFNLAHGDVSEVLPVFTNAFTATGSLNLNGTYSLQGPTLQSLFDNPRVNASFTVEKGTLNNVDIVRAVQSPMTDGIRGGKTIFNELSGTLQVSGPSYLYQHLRLGSGPMRANGEVVVNRGGELTGRIVAQVGTGSIIVARGNLAVRGNLRTPVLLP